MEAFRQISDVAVPIRGENVDTDQILPARFLPKPRAGGFAQYLFHDLRFDATGNARPEFPLNKPAYRAARILVGESNFGCGSSRENAAWAIADYGIRAVAAPSFGEIFHGNCIKNGVVPVVLERAVVSDIIGALLASPGAHVTVDLEAMRLVDPAGRGHAFALDAFSRHCLLNGVDELDYTLSQLDRIDSFARNRAAEEGWEPPAPREHRRPLPAA